MVADYETNVAALREERRRSEAATRENLTRYVTNRARAYEALQSLAPDSEMAQGAKQRLEKALKDLEEFERFAASGD